MTTRFIEGYNECTDPVAGDYLWIVDTSAPSSDKDRKVNISNFAITNTSTTFTRTVYSAPTATSDHGFVVNMPPGATVSARALRVAQDSTLRWYLQIDNTQSQMAFSAWDNGAGAGSSLQLQRNNNASTPAGGYIQFINLAGTSRYFWVGSDLKLRVHTAAPTNANDGLGTVVGDQTSHIAYKDVVGDPVSDAEALGFIIDAAARVKRFRYKDGSYRNQEFSGIVLDGDVLNRYGQDADVDHPAGKALSVVNAIGDLFLSVRNLAERVAALEAA